MTVPAPAPSRVVFLFDVDNTLLDNDRVAADLKRYLNREVGAACEARYWAIFEELRAELGYADYLGALQRFRIHHPHDPRVLAASSYLINYPFANRLFPGSLDAIEHVSQWGPAVIFSDGDVVFQPRKIERAGLFEAVAGRVLIYIHKENELDDVVQRHPADHYVLVDDKLRILTAVKKVWGARLTTIFPRQGHYAHAADVTSYPPADITIERIGDLLNYGLPAFLELFVSRWDAAVVGKVPAALENQLGIAVAKRTYKAYRDLLASDRWLRLLNVGARAQRLLWGSTGTKDPKVSDILYVKSLAAPHSVNTIPEKTLLALADHGEIGAMLPHDGGDAEDVLDRFTQAGIDLDALATKLQQDGAAAFVKSWDALLASIVEKSARLANVG